jgi:hypothetical protein
VGQPYGVGSYSPEPFILTGSDITSVTFNEDGYGNAGEFSTLDDIVLTPVPEPATYALIVACAVLGYSFWQRKRLLAA